MSIAPRRLAEAALRAVLRLAPRQSREWASAMQRELDFIHGDWAALFWALGSAGAVLRHAASVLLMSLKNRSKEERRMNSTGKKALGVGLGIFSALMLAGCAFAVLRIAIILFPSLQHSSTVYWMSVVVIPRPAEPALLLAAAACGCACPVAAKMAFFCAPRAESAAASARPGPVGA
jgi:hypothetical protein